MKVDAHGHIPQIYGEEVNLHNNTLGWGDVNIVLKISSNLNINLLSGRVGGGVSEHLFIEGCSESEGKFGEIIHADDSGVICAWVVVALTETFEL